MTSRDIIVAPVITEKSMAGTAFQQYAFEVHAGASKTQIKSAIREIFKVDVIKINTVNVMGKSKNFARRGQRTSGKQSDWKKAIVTLAPGQKIELGGVTTSSNKMAVKKYKPTSAGRRFITTADFSEITKNEPEKSLLEVRKKHSGPQQQRPHHDAPQGRRARASSTASSTSSATRMTIPAKVAAIEYDPNRTARIALLHYRDGEKRYILAPDGLEVGDVVVSGPDADIKIGNALPLANIPLGTDDPQHRAAARQGRPARALGRLRRRSSWPRKATTRRSACRRARCASSKSTAARRSVSSATSITRTK